MTLDQALAFAIIIGAVVLLICDRVRYDLVALLALLAALAAGIVPPDQAFTGFSNDIVIIVGSALVVSAAVGRSGAVETLIRPLAPFMKQTRTQVAVLVPLVTALSAFMKNVGALAIFLPIAIQIAKRNGRSASYLLMPLSFGSLLGGITTLIGTSPNIIVSQLRRDLVGQPFGMFDFMPVGAGVAVTGVAFLIVGWRLLPSNRSGGTTPESLFEIADYTTEVRLPPSSPFVGKSLYELEELGEGNLTVVAIIREKYRRHVPAGDWTLFGNDILVVESDAHTLKQVVDGAGLELIGDKQIHAGAASPDKFGVVEAVVTRDSPLIGNSAEQIRLRERHGVNLLALSRSGRRIAQRLRRVRFQAGDLIVLQGRLTDLPDILIRLGCLPLAERNVQLGRKRNPFLPVGILVLAMGLVAFQAVPVAVAFFGAAVAMVAFKTLSLTEAYKAIDWPILVLLGALIPVSDALRTTGGSELVAGWLSVAAMALPPIGALAMILVAAMAVTPFLNNAAAVLVMAPIAASLAASLGLQSDPFLMAVALGAACDFLTPIGHQSNTLVMGPGGYRFGDYWRLGLPLSVVVVVVGTVLISLVWPLT